MLASIRRTLMNDHHQNLVEELEKALSWKGQLAFREFLPETLFHYTSWNGLYGVVSSGKLWGTNYRYLNDLSEIDYGRELALETVRERGQAASGHVQPLLEEVKDRLNGTSGAADVYVTCFCATEDLLSQWRGYGSVSDRFCVGFDSSPVSKSDGYTLQRVGCVPRTMSPWLIFRRVHCGHMSIWLQLSGIPPFCQSQRLLLEAQAIRRSRRSRSISC
jgi:hypothetical protein